MAVRDGEMKAARDGVAGSRRVAQSGFRSAAGAVGR